MCRFAFRPSSHCRRRRPLRSRRATARSRRRIPRAGQAGVRARGFGAAAKPSLDAAPPKEGQPVNADARAIEVMLARINDYAERHKKLEDTLPKLSKESTPEQIDSNQRALQRLIQKERHGVKPGAIFTPDVQAVIKRLLEKVFAGPDGAALAVDHGREPADDQVAVNSRYPDNVPLSTVPPKVLQGLPKLPEEMEFRFVGGT